MDSGYKVNTNTYSKYFLNYTDLSSDEIEKKLVDLNSYNLKLDSNILELNTKNDLSSKLNLIKNIYKKKYAEYLEIFLSNIKSSRI
jgi:hypothetical protein